METFESKHYQKLCKWFHGRKMEAPTKASLPMVGFVEPDVAAGFLICTDTDMAILEFFISNPEADKSLRDQALDSITILLCHRAKMLGYKRVICDSQLDTIKNRAISLGFDALGTFSAFMKGL